MRCCSILYYWHIRLKKPLFFSNKCHALSLPNIDFPFISIFICVCCSPAGLHRRQEGRALHATVPLRVATMPVLQRLRAHPWQLVDEKIKFIQDLFLSKVLDRGMHWNFNLSAIETFCLSRVFICTDRLIFTHVVTTVDDKSVEVALQALFRFYEQSHKVEQI